MTRTKSHPQRSVPQVLTDIEKLEQGIVKLDVYSIYMNAPQRLIKRPSFEKSDSPNLSDTSTPTSRVRRRRIPGNGMIIDTELKRKRRRGRPSAQSPRAHRNHHGQFDIPQDAEGYEKLNDVELNTCMNLRLMPRQYLLVKDAIETQMERHGQARKSDIMKLCRIDVNKTSKLYDWFVLMKWIPDPKAAKN